MRRSLIGLDPVRAFFFKIGISISWIPVLLMALVLSINLVHFLNKSKENRDLKDKLKIAGYIILMAVLLAAAVWDQLHLSSVRAFFDR